MVAILLSIIAGILIIVSVALINELRAMNYNLNRHCAQNELQVNHTRMSLDILRSNYNLNKEVSELQRSKVMEELTNLAKANPAAVNDQITDAVTQKPIRKKSRK